MLYSNVGMNHATQGGDPDDKIILYRTFKEINNVPLIISSLKENYFPQRKETRKIMNTENLLLQPNEYWFCKQQISELVSAYHSVNDKQTIVTLQTLIKGKTEEFFRRSTLLEAYWEKFLDTSLTREKFEKLFEEMKAFVIPMEAPSTKQIEKSFRKVKKMQYPELDSLDFRELSYLGWNDSGTNRKYLLRKIDGRFTGVYGSFSTDVQKGHCAICNQISTVTFFLATTKSSGDGTYTKKGNYICTNSDQCNRQLTQLDTLNRFWETVTK